MRTNTKDFYDLTSFGLGNTSWQQFVDKFQLKYNLPQTDGFILDNEIQLDFTYHQLEADLGVATLPTYVDIDSPGVYKRFEEFKIGSNKIPTQKHAYALDQQILRARMLDVQRFGDSALNSETQASIFNLMFDSVDKLLAGNTNALTHQRMRIVSTGQFVISAENNPQGITGLTFDFGVPAGNKDALTGTARWWTTDAHVPANEGSTSDPLNYLKTKRRALKKAGFPNGHFEMSIDLYDDLLTHTKVLSRIGKAMYPQASDSEAVGYAQNQTDDVLKGQIEKIIGARIIPRDSIARVDKFDENEKNVVTQSIENFNPLNVSFVPDGQLGTIKSARVLAFDDPAVRMAWYDGGRTLIMQRFESKTKSMYVESEFNMLCVPQVARFMCIYTVTA